MKINRISDKVLELEKFIEELGSSLPENFEEYKNDFKAIAICERYFEKIVGAIIDLVFLVIKERNLKTPEEDKEAFDVLVHAGIIPKKLAEKLKDAKGMRNIIAHEYGKIDNELVFYSLKDELLIDAQEFIKQISRLN